MASVVKPLPKWFWFASLLGCTPGFKKSRCKKLLKVTMSRIKLLRGRREVQVRQLRRDVAQLLQLGQEENAESRLDRLWKEHSLLSAYIKTGEYCQLVKANLSNIAGQRECPMDVKESLASLCFAASCCADLPELQEIREIVVMKYGKDFLISAHELLPGSHVNKLFLEAFATKEPSEVSKKALLKGILTEYNVVQPKKPKLPPVDGGLRKAASSDLPNAVACDVSCKQQPGHGHGSNFDICKQHSCLAAQDQEQEKHHKSPKQIGSAARTPIDGGLDGKHAPLPCAGGDGGTKKLGRHKKHTHGQIGKIEEGTNETEPGSQDVLSRALSHDRSGKERESKRKEYKRNARVNQKDEHPSSNGRSIYEKSGPESAANGVIYGLHGYAKGPLPDEPKIRSHLETLGKAVNEKFRLEKEANGIATGQQRWMHECGEESPLGKFDGHTMHREKKLFNEECLAETKQEVPNGQPWKQRYHDEALLKDLNTHQMQQERNLYHKGHYHLERDVYSKSNGKSRSERDIQEFDKVQQEIELPRKDSNYVETKSKGYSRSNGKSRPERITNQFDNMQQVRSSRKRDYHVQIEAKNEIHHRFNEESRSEGVAYEIGNQQPSRTGKGSLPEYVDTHKVQRDRKLSSKKSLHENAEIEASLGDDPSAHISRKGRKKPAKKHHFEEARQEVWIDYNGLLVPGAASDESHHLHKRADGNGDHLKDAARQRDTNLHRMENNLVEAQTETCGDHKEARLHGAALEPYMEDEYLPEDYGIHAMQKSSRRARKHNCDHADSSTKVLKGLLINEKPRGESIAEEVVNDQTYYTNESLIREDNSTHVTQSERPYFPQWHHQFESIPKGCKESGIGLTAGKVKYGHHDHGDRSLPQVQTAYSMQRDQQHPESLDEHEDAQVKLKRCQTDKGSPLPSRFTKPPQRPPPPVPPYRVSSLPNRQPLNNPPALPKRCVTLETSHVRANQEPHVHPKLPEYDDLVASFAALRNKPAKPPTSWTSS